MSGSRHGKLGVAAVAAVALVAAGAALAASKLHGSTSSARAGFGATALADYGTGAVELRHQSYGLRRGFGFGHGPGDELQAAADYLGTTVSALITQVQSGKTLEQIADSTSGKSSAGLVDALVKHEQAELTQAVKDGKLTQSQADQISANLKTRMTALVNGTGGDHGGFGHHGFGPGPGYGGTPPTAPSQSTPPAHI